MITIDKTFLDPDGLPGAALLLDVLRAWQQTVDSTLLPLHNLYNRDHAVEHRVRLAGLPNNRLVHDFPGYIATMAAGYLVGSPVQYVPDDSVKSAFQPLDDAMKSAKSDCIDAELAVDASVYGKAVEIFYADAAAQPRSSQISPLNAFVVYDDTVEHKPLFGVTVVDRLDRQLKKNGKRVSVYTDTQCVYYTQQSQEAPHETGREPHYFGGIPLVEYWNNAREDSDFAPVTELIDAYDALQSDRVNDKQQFTDAIMVLKGIGSLGVDDTEDAAIDEETGETVPLTTPLTASQRLRQTRTLFLPGDGADADFMTKPDAESGNEVLRKSLAGDIHKFSFVPDLTDENFAGNTSGVAMRFKLLGLEQITKIKERWFRGGLQSRLKRFAGFLGKRGAAALDVTKVQINFSRSLPVNELEIAQMVQTLSGIVPQEILLGQVPFVEDPDEAVKALAKDKDEAMQRSQRIYTTAPFRDGGRGDEQ